MIELKKWLVESNLSQAKMAKAAGVSRQYLNKVLRLNRPALELRRKIAKRFNVPANLIFLSRHEASERRAA